MKKLLAATLVLVLLFSVTALALPKYTGPARIAKNIDRAVIRDADGHRIGKLSHGTKVNIIGWKETKHDCALAKIEYKGHVGYTWIYNLEDWIDGRPIYWNVYDPLY